MSYPQLNKIELKDQALTMIYSILNYSKLNDIELLKTSYTQDFSFTLTNLLEDFMISLFL